MLIEENLIGIRFDRFTTSRAAIQNTGHPGRASSRCTLCIHRISSNSSGTSARRSLAPFGICCRRGCRASAAVPSPLIGACSAWSWRILAANCLATFGLSIGFRLMDLILDGPASRSPAIGRDRRSVGWSGDPSSRDMHGRCVGLVGQSARLGTSQIDKCPQQLRF